MLTFRGKEGQGSLRPRLLVSLFTGPRGVIWPWAGGTCGLWEMLLSNQTRKIVVCFFADTQIRKRHWFPWTFILVHQEVFPQMAPAIKIERIIINLNIGIPDGNLIDPYNTHAFLHSTMQLPKAVNQSVSQYTQSFFPHTSAAFKDIPEIPSGQDILPLTYLKPTTKKAPHLLLKVQGHFLSSVSK